MSLSRTREYMRLVDIILLLNNNGTFVNILNGILSLRSFKILDFYRTGGMICRSLYTLRTEYSILYILDSQQVTANDGKHSPKRIN